MLQPADGEVAGHGGVRGDGSGVVMGESARRRDLGAQGEGRLLVFERVRGGGDGDGDAGGRQQ